MIYLNYNHLDSETQQQLLQRSQKDLETQYGNELKAYAQKHHLNYKELLEVEAQRNLYNYQYKFQV